MQKPPSRTRSSSLIWAWRPSSETTSTLLQTRLARRSTCAHVSMAVRAPARHPPSKPCCTELGTECASSYYRYGITLLERAQNNTGILGNKVEVVDEEDDEEEEEEQEEEGQGAMDADAPAKDDKGACWRAMRAQTPHLLSMSGKGKAVEQEEDEEDEEEEQEGEVRRVVLHWRRSTVFHRRRAGKRRTIPMPKRMTCRLRGRLWRLPKCSTSALQSKTPLSWQVGRC